jgi:hypothetical protein
LLTGEHDINREETQAVAERYKKDGFKYVTYIEVPALDHRMPTAEWFDKGIAFLDAPLKQK